MQIRRSGLVTFFLRIVNPYIKVRRIANPPQRVDIFLRIVNPYIKVRRIANPPQRIHVYEFRLLLHGVGKGVHLDLLEHGRQAVGAGG